MPGLKSCFFGWHRTERGCWRTAKGLGYSTPTPLAATERGTSLLAAAGKRGLSVYSLSFGLFGSLCLIKLNSPGQRLLTFSRNHKFYKLDTYTDIQISLRYVPALMCCCHIHPWKILGVRIWEELALAGCLLACRQERRSAYGVEQSSLITSLAWYLTCLQLLLAFVVSSFTLSSYLLLIKINVSLLENFTSCLGNVDLIIYTRPTFSGTPNLDLCFRRK